MKTIFILLIFFFSLHAVSVENKYTFQGQYTYYDVLTVLASPSKRSISGNNDVLQMKRYFYVDNESFTVCVEIIKNNLIQDGYDLTLTSNFFLIKKTLPFADTIPTYTIYQPFLKKWIFTKDKNEYLNAKQIDLDSFHADSVSRSIVRYRYYKCIFQIRGNTLDSNNNSSFNVANPLSLSYNVPEKNLPSLAIGASVHHSKINDAYNFIRTIIFYLPSDSTLILNFGNESRRSSGKLESERILTESYESVYDGLTLRVTPTSYSLRYRVKTTEINLVGVPDSLVSGSSVFNSNVRNRSFRLFGGKAESAGVFNLTALMEVIPIK